jgi:hypothetical protein
MATPVIPAWKKLGLKVKEDIRKDPLTGQVQATPAAAQNKPATNDNNKRPADSSEDSEKTKKPPKRVKLPKAERKAPPESDNLVYLRQYHTDRANWKFSKQKQNWILKNVYEIQADYAAHLMAYLKGLQGGARERVTQESFEVITHWNEYMKAPAEPEESEDEEKKEENTTTDETKDNNDEKATKKADKKEDASPPPPTELKARRAQTIFNLLTGNLVPLELLEEEATTMPDAAPTTAENENPVAEKEALQSEEPEKKTEEKKDKKEKKSKKEKKDKSSKKSPK